MDQPSPQNDRMSSVRMAIFRSISSNAAGAVVPILGSAAVEALFELFSPMVNERRQEWSEDIVNSIVTRLDKLEDFENLQGNPLFIDTLIQATRIALNTAQHGKRQALRNAVLNVAFDVDLGPSKTQLFLTWVDRFTEQHLQVLDVASGPRAYFKRRNIVPKTFNVFATFPAVVAQALPSITDDKDYIRQIWADLHGTGLVALEDFDMHMDGNGVYNKQSTNLGDEFLKFITEPERAGEVSNG